MAVPSGPGSSRSSHTKAGTPSENLNTFKTGKAYNHSSGSRVGSARGRLREGQSSGKAETLRENRQRIRVRCPASAEPRRMTGIPGPTPDVTGLLLAWGQGDEAALNQLIPLVQQELHRIARAHMRGERAGHSLQATALVNEAYLRLVDVQRVKWQNRAHFFAMSARRMRRVLVDIARAKGYQKRGGGAVQVSLDEGMLVGGDPARDLVALDDALAALATNDPRKSQVVEMRFFGGLSVAETAEALDVSPDTVMRDWKMAKAWLLRELGGGRRDDI